MSPASSETQRIEDTVDRRVRLMRPLQVSALVILMISQFLTTRQTSAAIASGAYQTVPDATMEEQGDRVPNNRRVMLLTATLTLDLNATSPSMLALISNAVLEGDDPFPLTVRSSSGDQLTDGTYRFSGDYLQDISPSGTQYLFDWRFAESTNQSMLWNGTIGWAGGHFWLVTISNVTLVPIPQLQAVLAASSEIQISWATNFVDNVLESSAGLPVTSWNAVTNEVNTNGGTFSVRVNTGGAARFYRLRKP